MRNFLVGPRSTASILLRDPLEIAVVASVVLATALGVVAASRRRPERPAAEPQPPEPASMVWEG